MVRGRWKTHSAYEHEHEGGEARADKTCLRHQWTWVRSSCNTSKLKSRIGLFPHPSTYETPPLQTSQSCEIYPPPEQYLSKVVRVPAEPENAERKYVDQDQHSQKHSHFTLSMWIQTSMQGPEDTASMFFSHLHRPESIHFPLLASSTRNLIWIQKVKVTGQDIIRGAVIWSGLDLI